MYCTACGEAITGDEIYCPACGAPVKTSSQPISPPPAQSYLKLPPCPRCGNTAGPRPDAFSTGWFIFFLCCLGLVPGIVYYALRHDKVRCAACRAVQ